MRSRRVMLRFLPLGLVAGLLASVMAWQDHAERRLGEDISAAPKVVVSEHDVPVVPADEPEPGTNGEEQAAPKAESTSPHLVAELAPTRVTSFSLIGVTWRSGVPKDAEVEVRWRQDGAWSRWTELHLDVENTKTEGGRPGTESQWVGHADGVAVRVLADKPSVPRDLQVATIDPGRDSAITPVAVSQPSIIRRTSWGAKSSGGCDSPVYGSTTRGAVIHHTAGSNSYAKSDSASIVRATQAYHMNSRGWCDIGYNFLIDKYGQTFEGRAGGIDKPVRGAHAGNSAVNQETMGVSLMGTFTSTDASSAMKTATVNLVGWRFYRYGIKAKGTYSLGGKTLNRIAGHRNVVSTECPGSKVYAWLSATGGLRDRVAKLLDGTAVPTGLTSTVQRTDALKFSWNAVPAAAKYQIRLSASSSMSNPRYASSLDTYEWFSGRKPGTTYYAQVRTLDAAGRGLSAFSPVVAAKTRAIDPANYSDTGSLYPIPSKFPVGSTISIAGNFPNGVFDVTFYRQTSTGGWKSIGTDRSNTSGNAYLSGYKVSGPAKVFALTSTGKRTEVRTIQPTIKPADYPDAGSLYTSPSTFPDGATITIAGNFPDGVFDVTFYQETSTGGWKSIGTDRSNASGNAYLSGYKVSGTARVFALTSTAKRTEVRTLRPSGSSTASATSSASAATTSLVSVPSSGSFTFKGHGYGHGIGMSQYGAEHAARYGKTYRTILGHYYPGTSFGSTSGSIRVLITGDTTSSVMIEGRSGLKLRYVASGKTMSLPETIGGSKVVRWNIKPLSSDKRKSTLRYRTSGVWKTYKSTIWTGAAQFEAPTLKLVMPGGTIRTYRTALRSALPTSGATTRDTVNRLSVENYTRGVVAREVPSSWHPATLKAQSVAARTYGVRARTSSRYYDICDTTSCQVYGGKDAERSSTNQAVVATAGKILRYDGKAAFTQFSSSSGGYTSPGSQPYLKAVKDGWDNWSGNPNHSWTKSVSASTIQSKYPSIGTLQSMRVTKRNGYGDWGGRVTSLELRGSKGTKTISGNTARSAFGLRSNWFTF